MIKKFTLILVAVVCCLSSRATVTSVDELLGSYVATAGTNGQHYFSGDWEYMPTGHVVTITKGDSDNTIDIINLLGFGYTITATVDLEAKTVTASPVSEFESYYTLAGTTSATSDIVGKINDDGSLSFDDFTAWYSEWVYMYYASVSIAKFTSTSGSVTGTISYYGTDEATGDPVHTAQTTLTKYLYGEDVYYGLKMDGAKASPEELIFTVDGDSITIRNGYLSYGYSGSYLYYCYGDVYYTWFDTSEGCSSFPSTNSKEAGTLSIYHYDYDSNETNNVTGTMTFTWSSSAGLSSVKADEAAKDAPIYDLMGRKVSTAKAHGVYIQNGKKFVK